jgi:hypothetical protein
MNAVEGPLIQEGQMGVVENPEPTPANSKPSFQPDPKLDEAAVRAAVMQAEANGEDPTRLNLSAVAQIQTPAQPSQAAQAETPVEVPEKFKKPNGEVDVEKLNASTKQLDELIQKKKEALQSAGVVDVDKFAEEQLRAYKEKERQLRGLPNANRVVAQVQPPAPPVPANPAEIPNDQLEAMINNDIRNNPARAIADLVQLAIRRELEPINEEKKDGKIRSNLKELAERDPRVVSNIAAINAKLDENPELWNLKNPHKAAWLEVKEDLRLGELTTAQTQPSKPVAPVLGGGTPPPAPSSSSGVADIATVLAASKQIGTDPRERQKFDSKKWDQLDAVARQLFK